MSKLIKAIFLIQAIIDVVLGALLFIIPGRFLGWIGWSPIEPLLFRLLGAALLAMAWTCVFGFQAKERGQVKVLIEMQVIFCGLGAVGFLRHLIGYSFPLAVYVVFAWLAIMAVLWLVALFKK
jgi:hypothetical protein